MKEMTPELKALEKELKVKFETPYDHNDKISKVKLPFPKVVWADLADKDGYWLPACCASISSIRDTLIDSMRESGWISVNDMQDVVHCMAGHHDFKQPHPLADLKRIYERIERHAHFRGTRRTSDLTSVKDACLSVYFSNIFKFCTTYSQNSMVSGYGVTAHDRGGQNLLLFNIIPQLKCLTQKIQDIGFPPIEGYAIIRKANNEVHETSRGYAFFDEKSTAEEVLKDWIETGQVDASENEIRAVRVSWEKGVEFLESVQNKWTKPAAALNCSQVRAILDRLQFLIDKFDCDQLTAALEPAISKIRELDGDAISIGDPENLDDYKKIMVVKLSGEDQRNNPNWKYEAFIDGKKGLCGRGSTAEAAIGNLIAKSPGIFEIETVLPKGYKNPDDPKFPGER